MGRRDRLNTIRLCDPDFLSGEANPSYEGDCFAPFHKPQLVLAKAKGEERFLRPKSFSLAMATGKGRTPNNIKKSPQSDHGGFQ